MPGDLASTLRYVKQVTGYEPQSDTYDAQLVGFWNARQTELFGIAEWNFAMRLATLSVQPDYATGLCTFTNGSNELSGSGTSWTTAMEGSYIQAATSSFSPAGWRRIGRVASTTSAYLEEDWDLPTASSSAHTIRQLFVPMPKDCKNYRMVTDDQGDRGMLRYVSPGEADRSYLDNDTTGTPCWYTDGPDLNPRTPERALTASLSATAGTLTVGRTYYYKYTWYVGGIETGCSPVVSQTPSVGNQTIALSGFQEISPLADGRVAYLYRADDVGIYYRIATVSSAGGTYNDSGTAPDRSIPYLDGNRRQFVRVYPRLGAGESADTYTIRYQCYPRELQKDSDYPEMPGDAVEAVRAQVIADVLRSVAGASGSAEHWEALAKDRIRTLQKTEIAQKPINLVRGAQYADNRPFRVLGTATITYT